jgi:hypothetical protein
VTHIIYTVVKLVLSEQAGDERTEADLARGRRQLCMPREELHNAYSSLNNIRVSHQGGRDVWGVARMGNMSQSMDQQCRLQPPAHAGSSLADFSALKMEAIRSSETSVHTRSTRRHILEYGSLFLICFLLVADNFTFIT